MKLSAPNTQRDFGGGPGTSDPGQYHAKYATLLDLIAQAYRMHYFQVVGKTPLDRDRFDVLVKIPAGATKDDFRTMMQNLLAERFHLKVRRESRDLPAWELVVAKSGLKIEESSEEAKPVPPQKADDGFPEVPGDRPGSSTRYTTVDGFRLVRIAARREPISELAVDLGSPNDQPVVDKTGLTGLYDYRLEYSLLRANADGSAPPLPDLFTAIQQQLGLQLLSKKLPFDVIVVDSVDRVPTEN